MGAPCGERNKNNENRELGLPSTDHVFHSRDFQLSQSLLCFINQLVVTLVRNLFVVLQLRRILVPLINRIRFGAKVREHVMPATRSAFVAQSGNIDRRRDDALARSG